MKKIIFLMEIVGAALLFLIMLLISLSSLMRYLFNYPIPDSDNLAELLLGTVVFWGIACAGLHDQHIKVDLLWEQLKPKAQYWMAVFSRGFTLFALAVTGWVVFERVLNMSHAGERTYDMGVLIWPFYLLAWLGLVASVGVVARSFFIKRDK